MRHFELIFHLAGKTPRSSLGLQSSATALKQVTTRDAMLSDVKSPVTTVPSWPDAEPVSALVNACLRAQEIPFSPSTHNESLASEVGAALYIPLVSPPGAILSASLGSMASQFQRSYTIVLDSHLTFLNSFLLCGVLLTPHTLASYFLTRVCPSASRVLRQVRNPPLFTIASGSSIPTCSKALPRRHNILYQLRRHS